MVGSKIMCYQWFCIQKHSTKHTIKYEIGKELTSLEYQRTFVSYEMGCEICTTRYQDIKQDIKQGIEKLSEVIQARSLCKVEL